VANGYAGICHVKSGGEFDDVEYAARLSSLIEFLCRRQKSKAKEVLDKIVGLYALQITQNIIYYIQNVTKCMLSIKIINKTSTSHSSLVIINNMLISPEVVQLIRRNRTR